MKINGKISILVGQDSTSIELIDEDANAVFAIIKLTPEQLSACLSRLSRFKCEMEVHELDKVGKVHESKYFEFEIPKELSARDNEAALNQAALRALAAAGMSDWQPDVYYRSQNSFFSQGDKRFARALIRRWV